MKYSQAIAQATVDLMERDHSVVLMGAGVRDQKGIFGTCTLAAERFPDRVIETPLSEGMLTTALTGMAVEGIRPIFVHARADFLTLSAEGLINTAAKWKAIHGQDVPFIVRCIIGQGWGNGPQHTQPGYPWLMNVPGLDVVMPYDSRSVRWVYEGKLKDPTVVIEHRRLYESDWAFVDEYSGNPEITIVAASASVVDALDAAARLTDIGVFVEVVPIYKVSNLSPQAITGYAERNTSPMVVVEPASRGGVYEQIAAELPNVHAVRPPHTVTPTSAPLEQAWYDSFGVNAIIRKACELLQIEPPGDIKQERFEPRGF